MPYFARRRLTIQRTDAAHQGDHRLLRVITGGMFVTGESFGEIERSVIGVADTGQELTSKNERSAAGSDAEYGEYVRMVILLFASSMPTYWKNALPPLYAN